MPHLKTTPRFLAMRKTVDVSASLDPCCGTDSSAVDGRARAEWRRENRRRRTLRFTFLKYVVDERLALIQRCPRSLCRSEPSAIRPDLVINALLIYVLNFGAVSASTRGRLAGVVDNLRLH